MDTEVAVVALAGLALLAMAYVRTAAGTRGTTRPWSRWRTGSFLTGIALLAGGIVEGMAGDGHGGMRAHVINHLVVGMYAPLALALAAPVTLALRRLPVRARRGTTRVLRARPLRPVTHPVGALVIDIGGLYLVHLTPLYATAAHHPVAPAAISVHYLAAGYLFAWALAGADPTPHRTSTGLKVVVLGLAATAHAFLAKLLYARAPLLPPGIEASTAEIRDAALWMYYGADIAELLLAVAVCATWYQRRARLSAVRTHTAAHLSGPAARERAARLRGSAP